MGIGHAVFLTSRYGDTQVMHDAWDQLVDNMDRSMAEPNQVPEVLTHLVLPCGHMPYVMGKGSEMATMASKLQMDWWSAGAKLDEFIESDLNVYLAPRGQSNTGPYIGNGDSYFWTSRYGCSQSRISPMPLRV